MSIQIKKTDNLYLIRSFGDHTSLIKLGYSTQIIQRLKHYLSHNPFIELIGTFYREDAKQFEKSFHCTLKSLYKREWYDESDLETILKRLNVELIPISYPLVDIIKKSET